MRGTFDADVGVDSGFDSGRVDAGRDELPDSGVIDSGVDAVATPEDGGSRSVRLAPIIAHELIDNGNDYRTFYPTGESNRLYAGWWSGSRTWVVLRYDLSEVPATAAFVSANLVAEVEGVAGVEGGPELLEVRVEDAAVPGSITTHEQAPDSPSAMRRPLRVLAAGWAGRPWPVGSVSRSSDLSTLLEDWRTLGGTAVQFWVSAPRTEVAQVSFPHPTLDSAGAPHLELTYRLP